MAVWKTTTKTTKTTRSLVGEEGERDEEAAEEGERDEEAAEEAAGEDEGTTEDTRYRRKRKAGFEGSTTRSKTCTKTTTTIWKEEEGEDLVAFNKKWVEVEDDT